MSEPTTAPGEQESPGAGPAGPGRGVGSTPAQTPTPIGHREHHEHLLRDADSRDDWAWRRAVRARRPLLLIYRAVVLTLGFALVVLGLILVPLPGPGWVIVLIGLAVLASEFEPANRLLQFVKARLHAWNQWLRRQSRVVQVLMGLLTLAFLCAVFWVTLWLSGVPAWLPDVVEGPLVDVAGLPRA